MKLEDKIFSLLTDQRPIRRLLLVTETTADLEVFTNEINEIILQFDGVNSIQVFMLAERIYLVQFNISVYDSPGMYICFQVAKRLKAKLFDLLISSQSSAIAKTFQQQQTQQQYEFDSYQLVKELFCYDYDVLQRIYTTYLFNPFSKFEFKSNAMSLVMYTQSHFSAIPDNDFFEVFYSQSKKLGHIRFAQRLSPYNQTQVHILIQILEYFGGSFMLFDCKDIIRYDEEELLCEEKMLNFIELNLKVQFINHALEIQQNIKLFLQQQELKKSKQLIQRVSQTQVACTSTDSSSVQVNNVSSQADQIVQSSFQKIVSQSVTEMQLFSQLQDKIVMPEQSQQRRLNTRELYPSLVQNYVNQYRQSLTTDQQKLQRVSLLQHQLQLKYIEENKSTIDYLILEIQQNRQELDSLKDQLIPHVKQLPNIEKYMQSTSKI